jgi:hypothetical protein
MYKRYLKSSEVVRHSSERTAAQAAIKGDMHVSPA